jgi:hypothetical protein
MKVRSFPAIRTATAFALLIVSGCAAARAPAADGPYHGTFKQPPMTMVTCPTVVLLEKHPIMNFFIGMDKGAYTAKGAAKDDESAATWKISTSEAGAGVSSVELVGTGATSAELKEVWAAVQLCEHEPR